MLSLIPRDNIDRGPRVEIANIDCRSIKLIKIIMKKKALILMSVFAMAMTVALAQTPDKGNGTCPKAKTECCAKSCADKKCDPACTKDGKKACVKTGDCKAACQSKCTNGNAKK